MPSCNYFYIVDNYAMPPDYIGEFEQLVLMTILRLGDQAYGATVRDEIADRTGRDVSLSAVYTTLERLEHKKMLRSRIGEPTPQRGGRRKRYFALSAAGEHALQASWQRLKRVAEGLEPLLERGRSRLRATSDAYESGISQMTDRLRPSPRLRCLRALLLRLRTPRRLHEWMAGDLEEAYHDRAAREGVRAARRWYWRQVRATVAPGWARHTDRADARRAGDDARDDGLAGWRTHAAALAGLCRRGGADAGARHRRQHDGLQLAQRRAVVATARRARPHRIVQVGTTFKGNIDTSFSYVDYQQLRSLDGFAGMAARSERPLTLRCPWAPR